jgi:hypothetical protein
MHRPYAQVVLNGDIYGPDVPTSGYSVCRDCTWRSKVFAGSRGFVMDAAMREFKAHRPPWWMRWMM